MYIPTQYRGRRMAPTRRRVGPSGLKKYQVLASAATAGASYLYGKYKNYRSSKSAPTTVVSKIVAPTRKTFAQKAVKKTKKLVSRVSRIERHLKDDEGTLVYRKVSTSRLAIGALSNQAYGSYSMNYLTNIELALAQLRYFNPSTPGTYTTVDLTSGSNSKAVRMTCRGYTKIYNNYQVPVQASLYLLSPKTDHTVAPATSIDNGLADSSAGPLVKENLTVQPTDSLQFNDLWKIENKQSKTLMPGSTIVSWFKTKEFTYDPSFADTHNDAYQKRNNCRVHMLQLKGVLGHDTTDTSQIGFMYGAVDVENFIEYTIHYPAGARIKFLVESSGAGTVFTNGGVCSEKPVADNIAYSVS